MAGRAAELEEEPRWRILLPPGAGNPTPGARASASRRGRDNVGVSVGARARPGRSAQVAAPASGGVSGAPAPGATPTPGDRGPWGRSAHLCASRLHLRRFLDSRVAEAPVELRESPRIARVAHTPPPPLTPLILSHSLTLSAPSRQQPACRTPFGQLSFARCSGASGAVVGANSCPFPYFLKILAALTESLSRLPFGKRIDSGQRSASTLGQLPTETTIAAACLKPLGKNLYICLSRSFPRLLTPVR
jgi:hypothetical protein